MTKKNKQSILYLMHIPWGWIKQRPHFIAEILSNFYSVNLFCEKGREKNNITKSTKKKH